jgi:TonB family protein
MKNLSVSTLLLFVLLNAHAQNKVHVTQYFDGDWNIVSDTMDAVFYRTVDFHEGKYLVKDLYMKTKSLQMEAVCSSVNPKLAHDGYSKWYYENGKLQKQGFYVEDKLKGLYQTYYDNGQLRTEVFFKDDKTVFHQHWSTDNKPLLINGTGLVKEGKSGVIPYFSSHIDVQDSIALASYSVSPDLQDTIYSFAEVPAAYQGGFEAYYRSVASDLRGKYPKMARRRGIEGKVFIQFTINKQGVMQDVSVLKGIGGGCDEVAYEVVTNQKKWNPAKHKNKPVKTRMVLPIVFKLT